MIFSTSYELPQLRKSAIRGNFGCLNSSETLLAKGGEIQLKLVALISGSETPANLINLGSPET